MSIEVIVSQPRQDAGEARPVTQRAGPVYNIIRMQFGYAGKLRGILSYSSSLGSSRNYFHIRGTEGVATVEDDRLVVTRDDGATRMLELPAEDMHEQMWRSLAECIEQNREPDYTRECALRDLTILFGVEQAIKTRIKVPLGQG